MLKGAGFATVIGSALAVDREDTESFQDIFNHCSEMSARFKKGDLSDLDEVLSAQLVMMHAMTMFYGNAAQNARMTKTVEISTDTMLRCSRATRQLAVAIAQIHKPKPAHTFVKNQQNNLNVGDPTNAPMDTSSKGGSTAALPETEAVAVQYRPTNRAGQAEQLHEFVEARRA